MQLITTEAHIDNIKREQLLQEHRLYQHKLVRLHKQRVDLQAELARLLPQKTPLTTNTLPSSGLGSSLLRNSERLDLPDSVAAE